MENMSNRRAWVLEALEEMGYGEAFLLVLLCGVINLLLSRMFGTKERFPPGPFALPLIGHLHLVTDFSHQFLRDMSHKYGPIVGLRLGQQRTVIVSSPELAKEVLTTHDKVFANRPPQDFVSVLLYGPDDLVFSFLGPKWRNKRKLCFMTLFTVNRHRELECVRHDEVASLLLRLHHAAASGNCGGNGSIDVGRSVGHMGSRMATRMLFASALDLPSLENVVELVKEVEHEVSIPTLGDFIPCLSFLDGPRKQRMQRLHDRCDKAVSSLIAEYKQSRITPPHGDLLQALLSKEVGHDASVPPQEAFTTEEIKAMVLMLLAGGIHTVSATLEWAMAELLRNPRCFQRLREELDTQLGKKKQITDVDIPSLGYLQCVVKEVLRLHPPVPLLLPRFSTEECTVNGYIIPASTIVFVNVWALHRDETLWPHAEEFMPERFEGKNIDVKGQSFELLPFGSGRRVCLGLPMALSVVGVTLANLVNSFDWELPNGETPTSMNMAEKPGITATKATPLLVVPKARI